MKNKDKTSIVVAKNLFYKKNPYVKRRNSIY